jgi:L-seryl-tRNA(Ser) seleniumtransferase
MEEKMSKSIKTLALGILILAGLPLFALAVDVSGIWEITLQSPQRGDMTSEMKIEQDGEKITVTMESFQGDELTGEGTAKDNKVEWTVNINTQRGDFSITYTGTVEGDTMSGEAEIGDFGSMEWTAKKKK